MWIEGRYPCAGKSVTPFGDALKSSILKNVQTINKVGIDKTQKKGSPISGTY